MSTPAEDPHAAATPREPRETGLEPPAPATASEILGQVLGGAARKAGLDPNAQSHTGHVVWAAMGGWRGVLESVLPGLAFVLLFTFTQNLLLSLVCSVGLAAAFTVARLVQRSTLSAALGGLIATVAAAALALWTGRGQDNFVPGLITNAAYGTAFLVSALIGWSLIGLAVGFLMNEGTAWRADPRKRRVFFWLAMAWAALFFARLAVQLPFYFSGDVTTLGTVKLVMGLPLFAPLVAVTWLAVRAVYPKPQAPAES
ncbi:DUF3159 domain-containing protein [Microbacterium aurum]|jgi:hypothetical protein|uniref:DUF3159 domain-containing protein n=1 Tax=Microbacterium aurum TaxID=36805 RepID=UPI0009FCA32B|nr:DUF3159 domain-containing protein [Microbacterium aurum]MBM7828378.1 hypothetical protein [Microbacterium aurum]MBZ6371290.1 DUF3159 domain-containing protein [Microbacterium hominis]